MGMGISRAVAGLVLLAFPLVSTPSLEAQGIPGEETPAVRVSANQHFIEGLYAQLDLADPDLIFRAVFASLEEHVVVYPTENYYYFNLNTAGKTVWGNLRLDASDRDEGIIHLGYFRYNENGEFQDRKGFSKTFSAKDGVTVTRLGRFEYSVAYLGKTVIFTLNDVGMNPPAKARLREEEDFVGPIFDESGLKFYLLFDKPKNHFFYILNEDGPVPEEFLEVGDRLAIGKRTGFAFYRDAEYQRKVLVAVHGKSMERNNYYDGPFDQLPDNYAEKTNIMRYIERAYPYTEGTINKFGSFLNRPAARVAITPYHVYYEEDDLSFVESCASSVPGGTEFYFCITPDFKQIGQTPTELATVAGVTLFGKVLGSLEEEAPPAVSGPRPAPEPPPPDPPP